MDLIEVDEQNRNKFCISDNVILEIAYQLSNIRELYKNLFHYDDIDTEFAFDGNIKFLQSRPLVKLEQKDIYTINTKDINKDEIIVRAQ